MTTRDIDNRQDVLDSRDVIARIEELQTIRDAVEEDDGDLDVFDCTEDGEELAALKALAEDGEGSPDWEHGETLIRESYFEDYARELAEDIGAIKGDESWPLNFIDWERAADELKTDYMTADFDGVTYYLRA